MEPKLFGQMAISLLLGLLIGLQRERADRTIGGIRTYPLIATFGALFVTSACMLLWRPAGPSP